MCKYTMKIIQYIGQCGRVPWIIVGLYLVAGCRDFQDDRTPYKSFVIVQFNCHNKNDNLEILAVKNLRTQEILNPPPVSYTHLTLPTKA